MSLQDGFQRLLKQDLLTDLGRDRAADPTLPHLTVVKYGSTLHVSCCEMTDATGENHCTHEPYAYIPPKRTRRARLRAWWANLRLHVGGRIGTWLAGERLLTRNDWDDEREDW